MGRAVLTILRSQWDRVAALVALLLGALALLNGWFGVSGTGLTSEQIPYILSGGLVGLFLFGIAAVLWLSADLRDEWRMLADLDEHLVSVEARLESMAPPSGEGETVELGSTDATPNGHTVELGVHAR
jgi:hypothetical protein